MKYEDLLELIFILLERVQQRELTTDQEPMLRNQLRIFYLVYKHGYTDGEAPEDAVKELLSDMTIWVLEQKGVLKREEVERILTNKCQMITDRARRERRKLETYKLAPLARLQTDTRPEDVFEEKKEREEADRRARQDFERIWAEIMTSDEDVWLFMKRLPITDPLWKFLGLVSMEKFAVFFYEHAGETFKMPTIEKIDRTKKLKPPVQNEAFLEEFVKQVNIWIRSQTSDNLHKK